MADQKFVPFAERPNWSDIKPVPQDDGPKPVVPIGYSDQFRDTMDYFRAILQKDERSQRAFDLSTEVIALNPANYTAWHFRRLCITAVNNPPIDLTKEMDFVREMCLENPKNYQIWYHRRCIVEITKNAQLELELTSELIDDDSKNYHSWAHRQWVLQTFSLWDKELDFIDSLLAMDVRNNSAWNQRFFVLSKTTDLSLDLRKREVDYAMNYIKKAPNNQSPWNYVKGMVRGFKFSQFPKIEEFCTDATTKWPACPHSFALLIDINVERNDKDSQQVAIAYCQKLAEQDVIHKKYWEWTEKRIKALSPA